MKEWVTAKEIAGIAGLSTHPSNVNRLARKEQWKFRKVKGVQGGGYEYAFTSLPQEVQAEYLLKNTTLPKPSAVEKQAEQQMTESAWNVFASATTEQERRAERRFNAVMKLKGLLDMRIKLMDAMDRVVEHFAGQEGEAVSRGSLKRWWYKVKNHPQSNWLPLLLDRVERDSTNRYAKIDELAWQFFLGEYCRQAQPNFAICYEELCYAAEENGWVVPSLNTLKRKFNRELTPAQIALMRGGEHALREMVKPQRRSVAHLQALEIINGDGYQHNVFVDWYGDGSRPIRPKTWFWQDVRTRRILAYCVDDSENGDQIRQATLRLIKQYGIPKKILMDNTRAASDLQTSTQTKRGKRNKDIVVDGLFERLGIQVIRTLVFKGRGNGRAKPIERAFRRDGLPAYIDRNRLCEGFFAGDSPTEKPENYQYKKGLNKAQFLQLVEEGVRKWNAKKGRQSELGQGIYSADELWARDYAQVEVIKPTDEQLRQLMMLGESTKVDKYGCFTLKAGYRLDGEKNTYYAAALQGGQYPYVVVRFDPDDLHGTVYVYDLNGVYLCDAICDKPLAFDSVKGAAMQRRLEAQEARQTKKQVQTLEKMDKHQHEQYRKHFDDVPEAELVEPKKVKRLAMFEGNLQRKVEEMDWVVDDDPPTENGFAKGVAKFKQLLNDD
ncbi:transposase domain-containing protein [Avibacterium paragallinarum]|uniref:Transposase n=1 Tax=Avibacterium paragallinarum TaxID=728 RepID=A0A8B3TJP6_AVIPA|nr:transposase domain-containing protein [Avibacterium paragallinarum]RZN60782.1 transposase [Avibacterium paragallinarum]